MFSKAFLSEIKSLALQIALARRGEHHLQDAETLKFKFEREMKELAEASEQWDELPDICYYATCLVIVHAELVARPPYPYDAAMPHQYESEETCEFYEEKHAKEAVDQALQSLSSEMKKRGVMVLQLEAGTLAKYRLRAVQSTNVEGERAAIFEAIDPTKHGMKLYAVVTQFQT